MRSISQLCSVKRIVATLAFLLGFSLLASVSFAQQLTGTLSGTVLDSAGAAVPGAKVTVKNETSGDTRTTVSTGVGYFSVTALQPSTYSVLIEAPGFQTWKQTGITLSQGESHSISNIQLQIGKVSETVEIKAGADVVIPDNAEVSATLNETLIQDTPIVGRDAGELLKIMPGMALTNGLTQGSGFNDTTVGTNNGPVGAYSANGTQPYGAMAYMLDGANLVDPGNAGTQIANINQDMVSEVKVLMSSYSAEYAKGPVIFQAFSKSGGSHYHGEGYFYARNNIFNAWDAYTRTQYLSDVSQYPSLQNSFYSALHPNSRFYYPGGNIGGPIPFITRGKQKAFFWGGFEYMIQHPAASPINYTVPTTEQRAGDFSETTIDGLPGVVNGSNTALLSQLQTTWQYSYAFPYNLPTGTRTMPSTDFDPNVNGILNMYPTPNITPAASNGWNNYQYVQNVPQNRWEATGKVDYALGDNDKVAFSYTRQIEKDQHPIGVWWTPPWTLPYPSNVAAATTSQEIMANYTHVFSPTTTNEFVFTFARYINPSTLSNPSAVDRSKVGFNVQGLFGHTTKQIPNFEGPWGGAFANIEEFSFDGSFQGSAFGATKKDPALYDNFTKVIGSHTLKAGFYWDTSDNIQSAGGLGPGDNGTYNLGWGPNSSGNVVADFLLGRTGNYQQVSSFPTNNLKFHQWSIYAQDSFKANRQLTVNYGLRFDHVGQWYGTPQGFQVWNPASYINTPGPACSSGTTPSGFCVPNNTGLLWHQLNSKIPLSGMVSPLFYYEPRVGLAYDIFGNGRTILRSGLALFHYQISTQVADAATGPEGSFTYQTAATTTGYNQISSGGTGFVPPSAVAQNGATVYALTQGDNKTPLTWDYNVTISQALPWRSVLEASYVGNKSQNEWIDGTNGKVGDINNVLPGALYGSDPILGLKVSPSEPTCNQANPLLNFVNCSPSYTATFNANDYRPLVNYQDVYLLYHGSYANYNSFQLSWQKQSGPIVFLANYSFSKVLGIRDGQTDNGSGNGTVVDPFNIPNNYGPLFYDHTHILNFSYVWNVPKLVHGNGFLDKGINGWQISGYTTYQSGAALQPTSNGDLNATYPGGLTVPLLGAPDLPNNALQMPNGLYANAMNPSTWLGSNAYQELLPVVTCDPRKHKSGAYFNPNCFAPPSFLGQQGTLNWPYMRGPAYVDSDLALYKNFQISERQSVQFRLSATNWLNHPLPQFGLAGNSDETLNFTNNYTMTENNQAECNLLKGAGTAAPCSVNLVGLSQTNTNTTTTGKPAFKTGSRTLLFALKYFF